MLPDECINGWDRKPTGVTGLVSSPLKCLLILEFYFWMFVPSLWLVKLVLMAGLSLISGRLVP